MDSMCGCSIRGCAADVVKAAGLRYDEGIE
jgi:hypothetical protein